MKHIPYIRKIWFADFEFSQKDGENSNPICMVAREFRTGQIIRLFGDELSRSSAPFPVDEENLFIAYYSSAEFGCFLSLVWPVPRRIIDLYAEFRCLTSGKEVPSGYGLLGALTYFGLDCMGSFEKKTMRELAMRGPPYSDTERNALLDYCQEDVDALSRLWPVMLPYMDSPRALLRGRYMVAAARMERVGVPIDVSTFTKLQSNWNFLQSALIGRLDHFEIWENDTFRRDRFTAFLVKRNIMWPLHESGTPKLDDETFKMMAKIHPSISTIRELRFTLSKLRLSALTVGSDGRNRCLLSAFSSKTGRNQPSNSRFIFGPAVWLRGLIKPSSDMAVAYIDYEQQEFGIAAALSGDQAMMAAYVSNDPYLEFAKQTGAVPPGATKASHAKDRERFKICALGVQYGMGAVSLGRTLGESEAAGKLLMELHMRTYSTFWKWSDAAADYGMLNGQIRSVFGWCTHVTGNVNPRSLRNFPMQANGADMLRLACCLATERGVEVCAPIHDALLIESSEDKINEVVSTCQAAMEEASKVVLSGFPLRTEAKIIRYPDRYADERGREMWSVIMDLIGDTTCA